MILLLDRRFARLLPGNVRNVRSGNPEVGKLTVAQAGKLAHRDPVLSPSLEIAKQVNKHSDVPFWLTAPWVGQYGSL